MDIIPLPAHIESLAGTFALTADTVLVADGAAAQVAAQLAGWLRPATGFALPVCAARDTNAIRLELAGTDGPEAYALEATPAGVRIRAGGPAGLFYGAQTVRQMLGTGIFSPLALPGPWTIPCARISDAPRFAWRGSHLDVCRHFMPLDWLRKYVDALALHKLNVLHLHLTDDQGWRIEIKKYPRLTGIGAWRTESRSGHELDPRNLFDGTPHGGYYSQDDLRGLVAYAAERHVTIVPEIEMPGHAQAAIAAYPELGNVAEPLEPATRWGVIPHVFNVEEGTLQFLQDVLAEVLDIFPSRYIHVGGDECPKDEWKASPRMQARIRELGLADEDALQSHVIRRMDGWLRAQGRVLIGWDEILEGGLSDTATVMSWRGAQGGIVAASAGHPVVMTPTTHTYFDYYQTADRAREPLAIGGCLRVEDVLGFEPIPTELAGAHAALVLGTQFQLWTEYMPTPAHVEYMAFPRACALAEVAWSPRGPRDADAFHARLRAHLARLSHLGIGYRPQDPVALAEG